MKLLNTKLVAEVQGNGFEIVATLTHKYSDDSVALFHNRQEALDFAVQYNIKIEEI